MVTVLLVESPATAPSLQRSLVRCGFDVVAVAVPESALFEYATKEVAAVVISMPLPGLGAAELCRVLRRRGRTPILVVTTSDDGDWLDVLDAGADDRVAFPCDDRVLRARVHALIRRSDGVLAPVRVTVIGGLTITRRGADLIVEPAVALTDLQVRLLERLSAHPGAIVGAEAQSDGAMRDLSMRLAAASGQPDALQEIPGTGWRLLPTVR